MRSFALAASLLALASGLLVPPAAACASGQWARSDVVREEVIAVGSTSVEAHAWEKRWHDPDGTCDGMTYAERCGPRTTVLPVETVGPVGVGPFVVPEVRVLGIVLVPQTAVGTTVPPATTPNATVPAPSDDPACQGTPYDAGLSVVQPLHRHDVGTEGGVGGAVNETLEIYRRALRICGDWTGHCDRFLP